MSTSGLRQDNLARLAAEPFDVLVIGGGINGAVAAASLSARGARVALVDRGDFAGQTSQASSNLVWGGIKYLESAEVGLVLKLCAARNELLRRYPSAVREVRFYSVHARGFRRSLALIWLGAWLYWLLGLFFTKRPRLLRPSTMAREEPLLELGRVDGGVEYSDANLRDTDARFVWSFVRRALDRGCAAANYVESLGSARGADGVWVTRARDVVTGAELTIRSRVLVNAAGPFVDEVNRASGVQTRHRHAFSKGVHLIVERLSDPDRVLTFFADDGRLFFVIPLGPRTCIGTTDTRVDHPHAVVTDEDRRFILDNVNERLRLTRPLTEADVISERCGVRPLVTQGGENGSGDWLKMTRKHVIEVNTAERQLSVFGGKLTDCLNVGQEVARRVQALGVTLRETDGPWYGEPGPEARAEFMRQARELGLDRGDGPGSPEPPSERLWRRYGAAAPGLLERIRADARQAEVLVEGTGYLRCELAHAVEHEMVVELEDLLRRRSDMAMVTRAGDLRAAPGVREACEALFGARAQEKLDEYFRRPAGSEPQRERSVPPRLGGPLP